MKNAVVSTRVNELGKGKYERYDPVDVEFHIEYVAGMNVVELPYEFA